MRVFKDTARDVRTTCTYLYEELAVSRCVALHAVRTYGRRARIRRETRLTRQDCALVLLPIVAYCLVALPQRSALS